MTKVPEIIPVSDLRQDAAAILKRVRNSNEPLIVTQRGRAAAVMLSIKSYERADHERQLLRRLLRGEKEIAAVAYIRRDKPSAASRFRKSAERSLKRLSKYPESGRHIPEFPGLPYREIMMSPYRFFYRIKDDAVWILAVWHGAQLPDESV